MPRVQSQISGSARFPTTGVGIRSRLVIMETRSMIGGFITAEWPRAARAVRPAMSVRPAPHRCHNNTRVLLIEADHDEPCTSAATATDTYASPAIACSLAAGPAVRAAKIPSTSTSRLPRQHCRTTRRCGPPRAARQRGRDDQHVLLGQPRAPRRSAERSESGPQHRLVPLRGHRDRGVPGGVGLLAGQRAVGGAEPEGEGQ